MGPARETNHVCINTCRSGVNVWPHGHLRCPWQAWCIHPGSLPLQSPLAGLAQNLFNAVIAGTTANQLGLTLKGQLIGRFGFRGPALKRSEVRGSPVGLSVGWGLGTGQCGLCLRSMVSLASEVPGVEACCYLSLGLTTMTSWSSFCPRLRSPRGRG